MYMHSLKTAIIIPCHGNEYRLASCAIIVAPSLPYIERAYVESRYSGFASRPVIEMLVPSMYDSTLCSTGKHVASLFCQHYDYDWPHWNDDTREQAARAAIDTVTAHAPNFRDAILGKLVLTPRDLEERFWLHRGDIFHGHLSLAQYGALRPVVGYSRYATPIDGLYMCASGTHPGGGVMGYSGLFAAQAVLAKLQ
jgi:phytoene dehydrogenase-like protein